MDRRATPQAPPFSPFPFTNSGSEPQILPVRETLIVAERIASRICNTVPAEAERVPARIREQFQTKITQGQAAVGFAFDERLGSYIVEPYED